ncbi:MAG TPA: hypothetical protein GXZ48_01290, partial [Acholeplasmataceae bacterium]|nr:hypothetical protein [Acholeplasmataceae bacterium]
LSSNTLPQILILVGSIILFITTFILNRKTKAPKGVEVPEKCHSCVSTSCIIKVKDIDKIKEELRQEIDNCDGENYEEEKQLH